MMTHLSDDEANKMVKISEKLDKALSGNAAQVAMAALNFTTLKVILSVEGGMVMSQAMAAAFMSNLMNSINSYYMNDDEQLH